MIKIVDRNGGLIGIWGGDLPAEGMKLVVRGVHAEDNKTPPVIAVYNVTWIVQPMGSYVDGMIFYGGHPIIVVSRVDEHEDYGPTNRQTFEDILKGAR